MKVADSSALANLRRFLWPRSLPGAAHGQRQFRIHGDKNPGCSAGGGLLREAREVATACFHQRCCCNGPISRPRARIFTIPYKEIDKAERTASAMDEAESRPLWRSFIRPQDAVAVPH